MPQRSLLDRLRSRVLMALTESPARLAQMARLVCPAVTRQVRSAKVLRVLQPLQRLRHLQHQEPLHLLLKEQLA